MSKYTKISRESPLKWVAPMAASSYLKGADQFSHWPCFATQKMLHLQLLGALTTMLTESQNKEKLQRVSGIIDLWMKIKARLPCPYFFNNLLHR